MILLEAAAEIPGSVWAVGISVAGALSGAVALLFRQLLAAKDDLVKAKDTATTAILAERAAATATIAPLVESVGKLATAVSEQSALAREQRDSNIRVASSVDRQTEALTKLSDRVNDQYRRFSSTQTPAVKP